MRRIKVMLAVVAAVTTMMVMAAPAMAQGFWWDPIDVSRITDIDPLRGGGGWEVEGEGTYWGVPVEFEWVCDESGFDCSLRDINPL
jgi:hypothetical protein